MDTPQTIDSFDDIWDLAEFHMKEALLLRSFLEYLRTWNDSTNKKMDRVQEWRKEIGFQLGNPAVADKATTLFQNLRDAPPELRRALIQQARAEADSYYFGKT
jgi:hypothetical protein